MTTALRTALSAVAAAALALVATAEAADHWLPGERWADGRVRDAACTAALASGNHCYDVLRPSSSSVPWALGALSLAVFAVFSIVVRSRQARVVAPAMAVSATLCAMAIVMLIVRSGEDAFGPLGRNW